MRAKQRSIEEHEYSSLSVMKIFAAFENECHLQKEIFEIKDVSRIAEIKETVLRLMNDIPEQNLSEEEKIFLSNVKSQIQSTGTKLGQTKKISNAYAILKEALEGSVEQILFMPGHKYKAPLSNKDVKKIAGHIVELRGKIVHGDYSGNLSKEDSTYIRLLEVIVYAQMAMRAGLNQKEIERIIGAVFSCNYLIQEEMLSGRKE